MRRTIEPRGRTVCTSKHADELRRVRVPHALGDDVDQLVGVKKESPRLGHSPRAWPRQATCASTDDCRSGSQGSVPRFSPGGFASAGTRRSTTTSRTTRLRPPSPETLASVGPQRGTLENVKDDTGECEGPAEPAAPLREKR